MGSHRFFKLLAILAVLGTAGCGGGEPKGQVIAVVNGEEITASEFNDEAKARDLKLGDDPGLRSALVRELVERKLLVAQARVEGLEKTPGFILAERRAREILLGQMLITTPMQDAPASAQQMQRYIESRPGAFGSRVAARADQLGFAGPIDAGLVAQLRKAQSVDEMASRLRAANVDFRRSSETWDSGDPASPLGRGEVVAREGAIFLLQRGQAYFAGVLTNVAPQPVPVDQQAALARALIARDASERRMRSLLKKARAGANIRYQPGFEPEADSSSAAGLKASPAQR